MYLQLPAPLLRALVSTPFREAEQMRWRGGRCFVGLHLWWWPGFDQYGRLASATAGRCIWTTLSSCSIRIRFASFFGQSACLAVAAGGCSLVDFGNPRWVCLRRRNMKDAMLLQSASELCAALHEHAIPEMEELYPKTHGHNALPGPRYGFGSTSLGPNRSRGSGITFVGMIWRNAGWPCFVAKHLVEAMLLLADAVMVVNLGFLPRQPSWWFDGYLLCSLG